MSEGPPQVRWLRIAEWLLMGIAAVQFFRTALPPGNADLISIQSLALDLRRGDTSLLYPGWGFSRNEEWIEHHEHNVQELGGVVEPNWCFYPPLIPFALVSIAKFSAESWRLVWGALQVVWIVLFVVLTRRLLRASLPGSNPRWVLLIALFAGSYPVVRSLELGQTSLVLALILWSAVLLTTRNRALLPRAGMTAAAGFVKPFLLISELPLLARHRFREVNFTVAVFALLVLASLLLAGWNANLSYWDFLVTLAGSPTAYYGNQSVLAGGLRLFTDLEVMDYGFLTDGHFSLISLIITLVILLTAAVVQWKFGRQDLILDTGWWLSAALLALPLSWEHHLVFLLPVLALLWLRQSTFPGRLTLGLATALITVDWSNFYAEAHPGRLIASFPLIGNLTLWLLIGRSLMAQHNSILRTR